MPASKTTRLRAVAPGEKPTSRKALKSIRQAADKGTQRDLLVAMKARVAEAVENPNTPARDLAALTKRLMEIVREIDALDARALEEERENAEATPDENWRAI